MIRRLYVHNFRCLENFELTLGELPSALLIGGNGSGKSSVAKVLEILQTVGRGVNKIGTLVGLNDFTRNRTDVPIRIEIEVLLGEIPVTYVLALELPERFRELRVSEEHLSVAGEPVYTRKAAQVTLHAGPRNQEARFLLDWHLVALPVIQEQSELDPLLIFKTWLARSVILAPIPSLMTGESHGETLEPKRDGTNIGEWISGLLGRYPAAYSVMEQYLRQVMPDVKQFLNEPIGRDAKSMIVHFEQQNAGLSVYFRDLSDGEKCFFLCAVVLAARQFYGPLFCFWDEPDNFLSVQEVGHFVTSLRRSFRNGSQILVTSHNLEAIRQFSHETTLVLDRKSHLEPAQVRPLSTIAFAGSLEDALIRDSIRL